MDLRTATKRILWGKLINCGQTCIAPDYVLCSKEIEEKFIAEAKVVLKDWYGDSTKDSPDLSRIINQNNFQLVSTFQDFRIVVIILYVFTNLKTIGRFS